MFTDFTLFTNKEYAGLSTTLRGLPLELTKTNNKGKTLLFIMEWTYFPVNTSDSNTSWWRTREVPWIELAI